MPNHEPAKRHSRALKHTLTGWPRATHSLCSSSFGLSGFQVRPLKIGKTRGVHSMIYLKLPTGEHGWGVVGDSLHSALSSLTPVSRFFDDPLPPVIPGPFLQTTKLGFERPLNVNAPRHVAYAVFEEDFTARRTASEVQNGFDAIATACRWAEMILRNAGIRQVTTIHHGVDCSIFHPRPAARKTRPYNFVVFSGGKFELRKGQDVAVKAFKIFAARHADAFLVAAWHNPWQNFALTMRASPHFPLKSARYVSCQTLLLKWLSDSGLDLNRVELVPQLHHASLARIYCDTDVGLFPNRCEGATNLVMMEYMACGRTVVATDFSGHRDVLTDTNSIPMRAGSLVPFIQGGQPAGLWCEPNVEEIVEGLEWAYNHRDEVVALAEQAGNDLANWTWNRAAHDFLRLLTC
jgi:glycosyltransferase involved in cell wall biosynthesis